MVWVGFAEDDEAKTVRPAAQAGFEEGYLGTLNVTWADTERGRGPTGPRSALAGPHVPKHDDRPQVCALAAEASKRGYVPHWPSLLTDGRAFGALTIYARKTDSFSDDEVKLLTDLAGDLAYGIHRLRLRAPRRARKKSCGRARTVSRPGGTVPEAVLVTATIELCW